MAEALGVRGTSQVLSWVLAGYLTYDWSIKPELEARERKKVWLPLPTTWKPGPRCDGHWALATGCSCPTKGARLVVWQG
jgi:hypothetical protein